MKINNLKKEIKIMKTNSAKPEAYIAVGKDRQKIYGQNTVYLKSKQTFNFELFNPTQDNIMAKISINGKLISMKGLILRPGMHGYLERYINEDRKFLFDTYVVDGESNAVQKAIESNGDIVIEFFKERIKPIVKNFNSIYISTPDYTYRGGTNSSPDCLYSKSVNCSTSNEELEENLAMPDSLGFADLINNQASSLGRKLSSVDYAPEERERGITTSHKLSKARKSIETGRVEKGAASGQRFNEIDMEFEYNSFHTVCYKLLPESQKPLEFNDLKLRCKSCSTRLKTNWKVCPVCGKKIDDECICSCGTKVEPAWNFCPNCNNRLK